MTNRYISFTRIIFVAPGILAWALPADAIVPPPNVEQAAQIQKVAAQVRQQSRCRLSS